MNELIRAALDLPPQASTFAAGVDQLHAVVFSTALIGSLAVVFAAAYFIARGAGRASNPPRRTVVASTAGEVALVAFVLSLFALWWVVGIRQYHAMRHPPANATVVYVTAKQWVWKFEHAGGEIELNTLTVPQGVPVEVVMTSRDVIHSFYVPAFRVKEDVLPGRYTTAWFEAVLPGEYPLRCAELCGAGHATMLGTIRVVPADRYDDALASSRPASPGARRGLVAAAAHGCLSCHSLDGEARIGPSWFALFGKREAMQNGDEVVVDEEYLTQSMMEPDARIVAGFANVMPRFQGALSPADAADIVELIESLRGPP